MSLESLNALKQLIDTRSSGASVQNDSLEKVQGETQQQGTSEAQRVDNLSLEKVKATYETILHQAKVERLQAQLQRENNAVTLNTIIAVGVTALGTLDFAWNTTKDAMGHQSLNDNNGTASVDAIDPTQAEHIKNDKNDGTGGSKNFVTGDNKSGGQTVYMAERAGNGSITSVGAASISKADIQAKLGANSDGTLDPDKAAQMGLLMPGGELNQKALDAGFKMVDGKIQTQGVGFVGLNMVNPKLAESLFKSKEHDVKVGEADNFLNALGVNTKSTLEIVGGAAVVGVSAATGIGPGVEAGLGIMGVDGVKRHELGDAVEGKLKADGKYVNGDEKLGKFAKSTLNGVVQLAEAVVPYFQALLAAKDKAQGTAEELQMATEKYAASMKKLASLERLISNAGDGGMGGI